MYVCICNAITETQIREAAESGADDLWTLQRELGVASGCGSCKEVATEILSELRAESMPRQPLAQPVLYRPAMA